MECVYHFHTTPTKYRDAIQVLNTVRAFESAVARSCLHSLVTITLLTENHISRPLMRPVTSSNLIKKIVDFAQTLGELHHRGFLAREHLKGLEAQAREESSFAKRSPTHVTRTRRLALEERREYLVRMRLLEQQELEEIQRMEREVESLMKETISDLLEGIKS